MATPQENLARFQEIASRRLQDKLDPDKRARFDEAVRRGLIQVETVQPDTFQERPTLEKVAGVGEAALGAITGVIAEPAAGFSGLLETGRALISGEDDPLKSGAEQVLKTKDALTFKAGDAGQQFVREIISGALEVDQDQLGEVLLSDALKLGVTGAKEIESAVLNNFGPEAATFLKTLPIAALEMLPLLAAGKIASAVPDVDIESIGDVFTSQSTAKQNIAMLIKDGSTDVDTAQFELATSIRDGAPRVKKDKFALESIKQGFDEGVIASVKGSSDVDKAKMLEMVRIKRRGSKNAEFAVQNRASDVLGDSLMNRVSIINRANKEAGAAIDDVAKSLKGRRVDLSAPADNFAQGLDDLGVTLVNDGKGGIKPNFDLSDLAPGDRGPLKEVIRQMNIKGAGGIDGLAAHKMKRAIDNNVTFGKSKTGMSGDAERLLKKFRTDIDDVLDADFPEYNRVNSAYSETIGALDSLQTAVGKKLDLRGPNADKATGTALRKLLSNTQGRVNLLDSINDVDAIAKKFENFSGKLDPSAIEFKGPKVSSINDNLIKQVLFVDELDRVFKPSARTGFAGQIGQAVTDVPTSARAAAVKALQKGAEKVQGINQEGAFKSIRDLLSRPNKN